MANDPKADMELLTELNSGYVNAYETGDAAFYKRILADDFISSEPDLGLRNKSEFLELISRPRPLSNLRAHGVIIRILGDFAIIHAGLTFKDLKGAVRRGRYTDDYQRRGGQWVCVSGNVIADHD